MVNQDSFTEYYAPLLDDTYDVVDRIVINAYSGFASSPGGNTTDNDDFHGVTHWLILDSRSCTIRSIQFQSHFRNAAAKIPCSFQASFVGFDAVFAATVQRRPEMPARLAISDADHIMAQHGRPDRLERQFLTAVAHASDGQYAAYLVPEQPVVSSEDHATIQQRLALGCHGSEIHRRADDDSRHVLVGKEGYQFAEVIVDAADEALFADIARNTGGDSLVCQFDKFRVNSLVHFTRRSETYLHGLEGRLPFPRTTTNAQNLHLPAIS